jgi:hypothetical protein
MATKPESSGDKPSRDESTKKPSKPWGGRRSYKKPVVQQPKFEGKCAALKDFIYDCSDSKQADVFAKTTKEISEYVGRTYRYGNDIRRAIESLARPTLTQPVDLPDDATKTENKIWDEEVKEHVKRKRYLEENLCTLYSLIWGQCTEVIRARIEAINGYDAVSAQGNSIELLKAIKALVYDFESQKYRTLAIHEAMRRFYHLYQEKGATCQTYLEKFHNTVDVLEHCGGTIGHAPGLITERLLELGIDPDQATKDQIERAAKEIQEKSLAMAFLMGADRMRYGISPERIMH